MPSLSTNKGLVKQTQLQKEMRMVKCCFSWNLLLTGNHLVRERGNGFRAQCKPDVNLILLYKHQSLMSGACAQIVRPQLWNYSIPLGLEHMKHCSQEEMVKLHLQLLHWKRLFLHCGPAHTCQADVLRPVVTNITERHPRIRREKKTQRSKLLVSSIWLKT